MKEIGSDTTKDRTWKVSCVVFLRSSKWQSPVVTLIFHCGISSSICSHKTLNCGSCPDRTNTSKELGFHHLGKMLNKYGKNFCQNRSRFENSRFLTCSSIRLHVFSMCLQCRQLLVEWQQHGLSYQPPLFYTWFPLPLMLFAIILLLMPAAPSATSMLLSPCSCKTRIIAKAPKNLHLQVSPWSISKLPLICNASKYHLFWTRFVVATHP